jgi:catalase
MSLQHGGNRVVTGYGVPVDDIASTLTVGYHGPVLLQDVVFLDTLANFDRERIPERVVHAKGAGKFGAEARNQSFNTAYTQLRLWARNRPIYIRISHSY